MQKNEGKFWLGLITGAFFFNKKKSNKNNDKGGCLYAVIWIGLIIFCFYNGLKTIGTVLLLPLIIIILISIIKYILTSKKNMLEEAADLYRDGQYTLALEKAEKHGEKNRDAAFICGLCYFYGNSCNRDYEKAFSYFDYAKKRNSDAEAYYSEMLTYGLGCQQDIQNGTKGLIILAAAGNTYAKLVLGELEVKGELIQQDLKNGMKNLQIAAEDGYFYADYLLGLILYHGDEGVPQDIDKGIEKLQNAAKNGITEAKEFLTKINQ